MFIIVIWPELYLLLNRPKIQRKQYPLFVVGVIDEEDTLKYSNQTKKLKNTQVLVLGVYELI